MKRLVITAVGILSVFALLAFKTFFNVSTFEYVNEDVGTPTVSIYKSNDALSIPKYSKSYIGFKEALALRESNGKYRAVNSLGYLGKYQFGPSTLSLMSISNLDRFLNRPELQEKVFRTYLAYNKWLLQDEINEYSGQTINGIEITESGILAAAHLAGPGNVQRYLRSDGKRRAKDAYGTRIDHYFEEFAYYDLSTLKAIEFPKV